MQATVRIALLTLGIFVSSAVSAQEALIGKWKGEAVDSEGLIYLLTFEVPSADIDVIMGQLKSPGVDLVEVPLNEFKMNGRAFSFALHIDERFDCAVEPGADGSYTGACQNQEGQAATLVLKREAPPA